MLLFEWLYSPATSGRFILSIRPRDLARMSEIGTVSTTSLSAADASLRSAAASKPGVSINRMTRLAVVGDTV